MKETITSATKRYHIEYVDWDSHEKRTIDADIIDGIDTVMNDDSTIDPTLVKLSINKITMKYILQYRIAGDTESYSLTCSKVIYIDRLIRESCKAGNTKCSYVMGFNHGPIMWNDIISWAEV